MAKSDETRRKGNDLDAFFNAAGSGDQVDIKAAIESLLGPKGYAEDPGDSQKSAQHGHYDPMPGGTAEKDGTQLPGAPGSDAAPERPFVVAPDDHPLDEYEDDEADGKFVAFDTAGFEREEAGTPFVLIPAHIHSYVPRWGWIAIGLAFAVLVGGVVFMPAWSLNRLASRLADENEANVQYVMRSLVTNGDERTVRKLYEMAASEEEPIKTRLRAVDTMTLINGVPEVERSLRRLELSGETHEQVRAAAIAARRQRKAAATTRDNPPDSQ